MGIRIQPREIDIPTDPTDDPFKNDLLDRKEKAEILTSLVSNIDGPCTMAVDAAWGAGKTTFLKMWKQHLKTQGFPVVEFNAWETDASGDPFVALTTEITNGLKEWPDRKVTDRLHQTEFLARQVFRRFTPGAIRLAAGFIPVVGSEVGNALGSLVGEAMAGYAQEQRSAVQYKSSLQALATTVWESSKRKPVVILIDELDRCRPSYAIELLETAKHIFGVDHVVFVLAVNRAELAHSVRVLYGERFDAEGYLRRFFDFDFRLPAPDRQLFITNMLSSIGVDTFLTDSPSQFAKNQKEIVYEVVSSFLGQSDLDLRSIGQAIHRFAVVLSTLTGQERPYCRTLAVLTVMSAIDSILYRNFVDGDVTSEQTIDALFGHSPLSDLRRTEEGLLVQSVIIGAEINRDDFFAPLEELKDRVPLFSRYRSVWESDPRPRGPLDPDADTIKLYRLLIEFFNVSAGTHESLGFAESIQRLDLISPDQIGNSTASQP